MFKGLIGRIGLLVVSSLLALGLAEVVCRQFVTVGSFRWVADAGGGWNESDEELGYRLVANYRGWVEAPEFRHRVEINSLRFRGPEPSTEEALWMLGDSFVFGIGVELAESLPGQVEAELARSGKKVPVWDLGVPSWSFEQYRRELERRLETSRPLGAVVVFYLGERPSGANDLIGALEYQVAHEGGARQKEPEPLPKRQHQRQRPFLDTEGAKKWLLHHSALYSAVINRFGPGLRGLLRRHSTPTAEEQAQLEAGWRMCAENLQELAKIAEREKLPLLVVAMPESGDLAKGDPKVGARFLALAAEAGIPALDLSPVLQSEALEMVYYPRDGHLQKRGNQLAADAVVRALLPLLANE